MGGREGAFEFLYAIYIHRYEQTRYVSSPHNEASGKKHEFEQGTISVHTTFNPTFPHYPQQSLIFTRMQDSPTLP